MNLKSIATLAAAIVATSAWAAAPADQKCGAATCSKKESSTKADEPMKKVTSDDGKDASCAKKEASCSKK